MTTKIKYSPKGSQVVFRIMLRIKPMPNINIKNNGIDKINWGKDNDFRLHCIHITNLRKVSKAFLSVYHKTLELTTSGTGVHRLHLRHWYTTIPFEWLILLSLLLNPFSENKRESANLIQPTCIVQTLHNGSRTTKYFSLSDDTHSLTSAERSQGSP